MARLRTIMTFAAVLAVAILVIGVVGLWTGVHGIAPQTGLTDLVGLFQRGPNSLQSKIRQNQRINVLLMARGGAGHDNPDFTDTMLLLSIQPGSRQAVLVSLPRFLLVNIPALTGGDVSGRLYSAYAIGVKTDNPKLRSRWKTATGPGDLAAATVAGLTQLPVDYWIAIDIAGFRTIVDALGGIDITVPTPLDDPSYPVGETERRSHIHFDAGKQRMDGDHALEYARSRLSTSEADRSARQELVVLAIMQRLHGVNAGPQLLPLLGALQDRMLTNMRPNEIRELVDLQNQLPLPEVRHLTVDATNFIDTQDIGGGVLVAMPRDGTFQSLRHFLAVALPDKALLTAQVLVMVSDGSNNYRLPPNETPAGIAVSLLRGLGWNAFLGPSQMGTRLPETEIRFGAEATARETARLMAEYFQAPPAVGITSAVPGVEVVLGSDFAERTYPPAVS